MFGNNPKLAPEFGDGTFLKVTKIFYTLQGEGPNAGCPAVFIRLSGCNLACHFCDTEFDSYETLEIEEILNKVKNLFKNGPGLVVITGGEPFRQNIKPLCEMLLRNGFKIQIETNGTIYREIPKNVEIVCSPKFPKNSTYNVDPRFFRHKFCFKFLVSVQDKRSANLDFYKNYLKKNWELKNLDHEDFESVYLQPMDEYDAVKNKLNIEKATLIAMQGGFKLSFQMHKILGIE